MTVKISELPSLDLLAIGDYLAVLDVSSGTTKRATGQQVLNFVNMLATPQDSTSGTSIDFTGIPAGVRRVTVMLNEISLNGTSVVRVQLAAGGSVEITGYSGVVDSNAPAANVWATGSGIDLGTTSVAAGTYTGVLTLTLLNATTNVWVASGIYARTDSAGIYRTVGRKALLADLDRIRITTVNGSDTFDAGEINIAYE